MLIDQTLKKTMTLRASPEAVWDALTNPEKIKLYLFGTQTICDWKKGSPIAFTGEWEGGRYTDRGTILEIEKNRHLKYSYWSSFSPLPDLPENYSILTFTLHPRETEVDLTLEQWGFPDEKGLKHSEDNWGTVLEALRKVIEE